MFSWSNNNSNNTAAVRTQATASYPAVRGSIRPPEYTRQQHLDSFLQDETLKRSTRKVSVDDTTYDTVFQTVSGVTLILRVNLPTLVHPSSPIRRPSMSLAGVKARHAWLDQQMQVVGYAPIESDDAWRNSRLLLGASVHQVIQQLQVYPPEIVEITDKGLRSIQPKQNGATSRHSYSGDHNNNHQQQQQQRLVESLPNQSASKTTSVQSTTQRRSTSQHMSLDPFSNRAAPPDYNSSFSSPPLPNHLMVQLPRQFDELESLSLPRMQELLDDELEFMAFCHKLPTLKTARSRAMEVFEKNVATSKNHLQKQHELDSLSLQVTSLRDQLQARVNVFQALETKQNTMLAPPDDTLALRQLALEKKQYMQESEQIAEEWLDQGAENPLGFVKEFVERRKQHHVAAAKIELIQRR